MSALNASSVEQSRALDARQREARRQRSLLAAVFAPQPTPAPSDELAIRQRGARWQAGLSAYRTNGVAHAIEALRAQFPTVLAMLGEQAFEAVCMRHWRSHPPRQGDLAWVGIDFPQSLAVLDELLPWPWLADCARLDLALWQVLFEPRPGLKQDDLQRLAAQDPMDLNMQLAPGTRLLASPWPIVTLRRLHCEPEPDALALRTALQQPGETAWVWREGLQAQCSALAPIEVQWISALQTSPTLAAALDVVQDDFDLAAWLHLAVVHGWLESVQDLHHTDAIANVNGCVSAR
ncbi:DNA-binding domain-containing protein [Thiomonas sp. FB-Cd]|uniref:HvfC/BufC N-terminal domain-containing protein n=1 Tax=Thiomonas sp. FB-Cd TaxID=1158292 RepID=UPI0004DF5724|nr:DNA-binding domain-containing protein [Thiomonas sp. FB-Cd]